MNVVESACYLCRKLAAVLMESAWRRTLIEYRVAAGVEHTKVLWNLGKMATVVDIGANRGQFALAAAHCFPVARIYSFEPLREPANTFRRVFAMDSLVHLHEAAIGAQKSNATIHVSARDDSSSLLPITEAQDRLFPGTAEAATKTIEVGRLVDYIKAEQIVSPALLKLDVQGYELKALVGCEELLGCFTWVYVECSFVELYEGQAFADEVIAWLREHGFRLGGVYNMAYDRSGRAVQADFLFGR